VGIVARHDLLKLLLGKPTDLLEERSAVPI
jgi:hypothetical protein